MTWKIFLRGCLRVEGVAQIFNLLYRRLIVC